MKYKKSLSILIFFLSCLAAAQVFIPFVRGNTAPTINPANPIYVLSGSSSIFTASGGMGVYSWAITAAAITDGASITFLSPTDTIATYNSRLTSYTTDILTLTTPGYANVIRNIITYDPLTISPTSLVIAVTATQTFTATGGCLNGTNCVGGARVFSIASGIGTINASSGLYTAPVVSGTAVVQVADSIGNVATADVIVTNSLTMSPTSARVPIFSTALFSAILGTTPYTFSVPIGTGTVGCRSTLSAAHNTVVTTITVTNTTGCPTVGSIVVGSETICYTGTTATTFTGAVRGCNATTAASYITATPYNSARTVYTAPTMIGSATVRVTDSTIPTAGFQDSTVTIIKPVDVQVGQYFACALYDEGSVKCWGTGSSGQLGIGSTATIGDSGLEVGAANQFVNLGTGRRATKISVGLLHVCAILDDATLKCWGNGGSGRLGYGNITNMGTTVANMAGLGVVNLGTGKTATSVHAFGAHTCAILNDFTVKCWGLNSTGQLGSENITNYGSAAGEMGNSLPVVNLGAGRTATKLVGGLNYTCALLDDATVKCWGSGRDGVVGKDFNANIGDSIGEMGVGLTAINIGAGRTATDIVGLYDSACVKRDDNSMICWGNNIFGQVGRGSNNGNNVAIGDNNGEMATIAPIAMGTGFGTLSKIYGHGQSACAEDTLNVVKCWGYNAFGQLLLGNTTNQLSPSNTAMSFGTGLVISKFLSREDTACILFTNERIKCFGKARTATIGIVNGALLNGSVENSLGDVAGELGNLLPYVNH